MSFNPHKGLSRLINILFWTTITGAIIALLASIWSFLVISTNLKSFGTSVLMRYTLRLLTVQQFQRAAALMCACEKVRVHDKQKWGTVPFQVGLWVGASVTPNTRKQAKQQKNKLIYYD